MDRLGEMDMFVRVVSSGGFSAAARAHGLTPSAVSKLVTRLEERLGARLLNRTTRRLNLTEEGRAFHDRCVRILAEIDEAEQAVGRRNPLPSGTLRVNAAVAFATYQLVPLLPEFMARNPLVHIELTVTDRVVDLVEECADVGIRTGARFESQLVSRLLADDHRVIVAAPSYLEKRGVPQVPTDLLQHNCLMRSGPQSALNAWCFAGDNGDSYVLHVKGNAEANNGETLYEMTVAGLGVCRLAEFRVAADLRAGRLVLLLDDVNQPEPLPIHVVYPTRKHLSPKVRAFVDFLVEKFTPVPPWVVPTSS